MDWTPVAATAVGVLGTFGASAFTLWITGRHEGARQDRARAEALVNERRAVYAKFLSEIAPWLAYVDQIAKEQTVDGAPPAPPPGDIREHQRKSVAEINLLSSREIASTSQMLWLGVRTAVDHIRENQGQPAQLRDALQLMNKTYRICLDEMRAEVGLDPPVA